jgi:anaerobic magnesium-protoporphyrin IX monomethyl ester cyclase
MILLINPKTSKSHEVQKAYFREPNLGLLYLAAVLESHNIPVDILDLEQYLDFNKKELEDLIRRNIEDYRIFGITSLTNTFHLALDIARIIKDHNKNNYTVLGGPHVTFLYNDILNKDKTTENLIDFICIGEAENSFLKLVQILMSQTLNAKRIEEFEARLCSIPGVAFINTEGNLKVNDQIIETDIDKVPIPARYKLSHEYYYYTVASVIVNRGCPNQCSFCSRQKLFKRTKIRSIDSILSEIKDIISMQTYNYINFYDNININRNFFKDFCRMFIDHDIKIPWGCEIRVDTITDKEALLLKKAGCHLVATGIESASIEVLERNLKYQNPKGVVNGLRHLKNNNIPIQAYFVLGLPGETRDTFQNTIDFIKELPLDQNDKINYFVATPYPGSRLWDDKLNFELNIIEKDFTKYDCEHIIFETKELNTLILEELHIRAKELEQEFKKN